MTGDPSGPAIVVATDAPTGRPRRFGWLRYWRWALFVGGVGAASLAIVRAGPAMVAATLLDAGAWVPLIVLLEASWIGMDIFSVRALLGARASMVPPVAYATSAI